MKVAEMAPATQWMTWSKATGSDGRVDPTLGSFPGWIAFSVKSIDAGGLISSSRINSERLARDLSNPAPACGFGRIAARVRL
jgi:hypothetical protein